MTDLHFVDFGLIPSPVRKEQQFRLPDDYSEFAITIVSRTSHCAVGFPGFLSFHITDRLLSDPQNVFSRQGQSKTISTFLLAEVEIVAY